MRTRRKAFFVILFMIGILFSISEKQVLASDAKKEAGSITVNFDVTGGESDATEIVVTYGSTYGELPEATRENYVFQGWYTFKIGGSKVTSDTKIIKSISHTLYAHWRGEPNEITLDTNGGSFEAIQKTKNIGGETQDTNGETQDVNGENPDTEEGASDTTTVKVYYGSKYLQQLPTPTRSNYVFDGWYTDASEGKKVTANSIFKDSSENTLYAHWIERQVKVVFIAFNGERYEKYVSYGLDYGELPEPEREGYTFEGWYQYKDYTNYKAAAVTEDTVVKEAGQVKLFARWYRGDKSTE